MCSKSTSFLASTVASLINLTAANHIAWAGGKGREIMSCLGPRTQSLGLELVGLDLTLHNQDLKLTRDFVPSPTLPGFPSVLLLTFQLLRTFEKSCVGIVTVIYTGFNLFQHKLIGELHQCMARWADSAKRKTPTASTVISNRNSTFCFLLQVRCEVSLSS